MGFKFKDVAIMVATGGIYNPATKKAAEKVKETFDRKYAEICAEYEDSEVVADVDAEIIDS